MNPRHLIALLLFLLVALAPPARAQTPLEGTPNLIDYQGTALDSNGNPLAPSTPTNYTMKFRLYSTQSGGSPIWSESQTVTVSNGQFSVRLGQGILINGEPRPVLNTVFTGKDRYLGLTIVIPPQAEGEITPRLAFLSSPFSFVAERAKTADSVLQSSGTSTLGTTSITNLTIAGPGKINGNNVIEFGGGVAGKQTDAGKIGYGTFTNGALDIVGAGTNGSNRKVQIFAEGGLGVSGGAAFSGAISAAGAAFSGPISAGGATFSGNETILNPATLSFGANTRQMLNLWDVGYGLGVQNSTLYSRSGSNFAWFVGGTHNDAQNNPGAGGTLVATLNQGGFNLALGSLNVTTPNTVVSVLSSPSNIGTWLALQNTSAGAKTWQFISTGSGNGEGTGKLLLGWGDFPGQNDAVMTLANSGNVGIGTSSPQDRLHIGSNGAVRVDDTSGRYIRMYRSTNGFIIAGNLMPQNGNGNSSIQWDGDGNWDQLSDATLKHDITEAEPVLGRLMELPVRRYRWKDRPSEVAPSFGVVAQEVKPLFPDVVGSMLREGDSEEVMTVKYGAFGLIAAKAVQELKKEKDAEVNALREENARLRDRLTALEANDKARDAKLAAIEKLLPGGDLTARKVALNVKPSGN